MNGCSPWVECPPRRSSVLTLLRGWFGADEVDTSLPQILNEPVFSLLLDSRRQGGRPATVLVVAVLYRLTAVAHSALVDALTHCEQ